jgi:hypothetical protein
MVAPVTRDQRRASAGTASGIFALLSALLVLLAVVVAFFATQPAFTDDVLASHPA